MNQDLIKENLTARFGEEVILGSVDFRDQVTVTVPKDKILEICEFLRDDPKLRFDYLSFVCGVDRLPSEPRFEVVYQLYSHRHNHRFRIKAQLEEPTAGLASIDSVVPIWPTADWHERETAEMYGITFKNHPDPRKLLLADHWKAHPLRKDFPLQGSDEETPDLPA
ncbi:MAG: NADH-quinone oxidoreductase subunit C [Desulfomonile tiedjei]|uniref:NADH-quinone oxidoreductase subunit C n=1 Tax=Desulfomonile tiedjei TaxID=2358 RepID=A0A9D6UZJ4_9BACT|nr:NADH-quinone oxidoreductase subunit C [Desulfomonile tiedjei]